MPEARRLRINVAIAVALIGAVATIAAAFISRVPAPRPEAPIVPTPAKTPVPARPAAPIPVKRDLSVQHLARLPESPNVVHVTVLNRTAERVILGRMIVTLKEVHVDAVASGARVLAPVDHWSFEVPRSRRTLNVVAPNPVEIDPDRAVVLKVSALANGIIGRATVVLTFQSSRGLEAMTEEFEVLLGRK